MMSARISAPLVLFMAVFGVLEQRTFLKTPDELWSGDPSLTSTLGRRRRQQQAHRNNMSACMIVGNDNHQLSEWVAYHYTVLPLRHIIVGVDENSTEDPMDVMRRWNGTDLQFQVWYPDDYAQDIPYQSDTLGRYLQRQIRLYTQCLQYFHRQNHSWVTLVDADEYIKLNPLDDIFVNDFDNVTSYQWDADTLSMTTPLLTPNETLWGRIEERKRLRQRLGLDRPTKNNSSSESSMQATPIVIPTVLEALEEYSDRHGTFPCHLISRRRYSAVTDNFTALAENICHPKLDSTIASALNISKLSTIQFLYHFYPNTFTFNEWAKTLIDLRRVKLEDLYENNTRQNPHRPFFFCPDGRPYLPDIVSPIHANHYINHWSVYSARRGVLSSGMNESERSWSMSAHIRDYTRCDQIHGWLNEFVGKFGLEQAQFQENDAKWLHKENFLCDFTTPQLFARYQASYQLQQKQLLTDIVQANQQSLLSYGFPADSVELIDTRSSGRNTKANLVHRWLSLRERSTSGIVLGPVDLATSRGRDALADFFAQQSGESVVCVTQHTDEPHTHQFGNTSSGVKQRQGDTRTMHIINAATIRDITSRTGIHLNPTRFRPNIVIDGIEAWSEFEWVGKRIQIGPSCQMSVLARTVRCDGVSFDPIDPDQVVDIPRLLMEHYPQHGPYLGVYAALDVPGTLSLGDSITPL